MEVTGDTDKHRFGGVAVFKLPRALAEVRRGKEKAALISYVFQGGSL